MRDLDCGPADRAPADPSPRPEPATIVFCIERGRLEQEALVMLESLRRWGGELGQSRVLGVIPRRGQRLRGETLAAFEKFDVELHDVSAENPMPWFNYYGKIAAVRLAERIATTPVVIWLDCDVLVFRPLYELGLPHGDDFTARREATGYAILESGREKYLGYWRRACEIVGVDWEAVPWCLAEGPHPRQKLVFNAGVFAFRRGKGFVDVYDDFTRRLLRAGVAYAENHFQLNEQNALGLAMQSLGLRFRELSRREHYMAFHDVHDDEPRGKPPSGSEVRLVHHSLARTPPYWERFMMRIEEVSPEHVGWLRSKGPIKPERRPRDPVALGRKIYRRLRVELQRRRCARVSATGKPPVENEAPTS